MHTVELSNHPGDMLDDASRRRAAAERHALSVYEDALIRYRARVQTIRVKRDRARARHRWWAWLRLALAGWKEKRGVPRPPVAAAAHTDLEEKLLAGIAGERRVAAKLGAVLDDDWTLLHGYRNRRGEIDHLLLGPAGLFAIEVKNLNATVHVDGDRWRADKYDNYGNLVEQRVIADRTGRSPSAQLNEPADDLERFLHQRGQPVTIQRAVILAHRRSRIGAARNLTVLIGTSADYLLSLIDGPSRHEPLTEHQRTEIRRLIQHDHARHDKQRHDKRRRAGPRPPR
jgi:Nuclease-related domain